MKREKTRQKKPSRDNSISDPDIYEVVPFVEITRIVVPERLTVKAEFTDEDGAASESLINEQKLNGDVNTFNQILNA